MIRGGEGLIWNALLPGAALAQLACPGLLSHAPSRAEGPLSVLVSVTPCVQRKGYGTRSGWGEGSRFQGV